MKTKRFLTLLLVMMMTIAMVGTLVGCGGKDTDVDKKTESRDDEDEEKDTEDEAEDAEATATPEPTPTPEVIPTAEELMKANMDCLDDKIKAIVQVAYEGTDGTDKVAMKVKASISKYENVEYQDTEIFFEMMGYSDTSCEEVYYVDDEESGMRTEYSYDTENETWVKSEYAYIDMEEEEEDSEEDPLEGLANINVTKDGNFYVLTGELNKELASEAGTMMGMDEVAVADATCDFKFDAATKRLIGAEYVIRFNPLEMDGATINMDDCVCVIEVLTEPIVIPEEVLAAEIAEDADIDWEVIPGADDTDGTSASGLPASWGGWYDEYNSKTGTFLMWDDATGDTIPVTLNANENWYFDDQYQYSAYLVVNEPEVYELGPAYEVEYSDSDAGTANLERAAAELLTRDYSETRTLEDVVPIVCNERQCLYLETTAYDYTRTFVVFQDIGFDTYVEISIMTPDLDTDSLEIIQKFLIDLGENNGQAI